MRRRVFAPFWLAAIILYAFAPGIHAQSTAERIDTASREADSLYTEWFGSHASGGSVDVALVLSDDPRAMRLESAIAFELARRRFAHLGDDGIADGLAWYLQSRVVERVFERAWLQAGYRYFTTCWFGCYVPWTVRPVILDRWRDGVGRVEYLRLDSNRRWPVIDRRPAAAFDRPRLGAALAFASLERELGWPVLQGALRVLAGGGDGNAIEILERATGRDLKPVFEAAANGTDHAIADVVSTSSAACAAPCVVTQVRLRRSGPVPFPLDLHLSFADGASLVTRWRGADDQLTFESVSAAARVRLDPDREWLIDRNFADNEWVPERRQSAPAAKWIAYWIMWLQDAALTFTFAI